MPAASSELTLIALLVPPSTGWNVTLVNPSAGSTYLVFRKSMLDLNALKVLFTESTITVLSSPNTLPFTSPVRAPSKLVAVTLTKLLKVLFAASNTTVESSATTSPWILIAYVSPVLTPPPSPPPSTPITHSAPSYFRILFVVTPVVSTLES